MCAQLSQTVFLTTRKAITLGPAGAAVESARTDPTPALSAYLIEAVRAVSTGRTFLGVIRGHKEHQHAPVVSKLPPWSTSAGNQRDSFQSSGLGSEGPSGAAPVRGIFEAPRSAAKPANSRPEHQNPTTRPYHNTRPHDTSRATGPRDPTGRTSTTPLI